MFDEDDDELKAQFYGLGDYDPRNPDLAMGSTAKHIDSAPLPESAPNPLYHDAEEMIRELVAALESAKRMIENRFTLNVRNEIPDWYKVHQQIEKVVKKAKGRP